MAKADEPKIVRLRNTRSGAVVNTTEENSERLGSLWEPATKTAKKAADKK